MTSAPTTPALPAEPTLTQISADRAIALSRWWLRLALAFNVLMIGALLAAFALYRLHGLGALPAMVAFGLWAGVIIASMRGRQLAADAAPLIAAGEFGLAEDRLSQSLRSFSVLRSTKLLGLQQLALLRHAQARWAEAAALCRELLAARRSGERAIDVPVGLMLAESLLEADDAPAAGEELSRVTAASPKLDLRETLLLTQLRIDLDARAGRWAELMRHPRATLGLLELMPAAAAARCHAALALAARRLGRDDWHALLARRATLLSDVGELVKARKYLQDAFSS